MRASDLIVRCLENEGTKYIFGIPGEEILALLDSLSRSSVSFIPTRHEQGAAFMADVYGRLTGKPGLCLSTLGPGAMNLMTGVADAFLDRAPMVAMTGQSPLEQTHKESHQYLDLVGIFRPVTKWNVRLERPDTIPEVIRKAFKVAIMEKPGPTHIELPSNVLEMDVEGEPLSDRPFEYSHPNEMAITKAAALIADANYPIIIAGNGVLRRHASQELTTFAQKLHIPVANTFMGKGSLDSRDGLSLLTVGLQAHDWIMCGLDKADLVITVGYDLVEYAPRSWNPDGKKRIIHIDTLPSEVDQYYQPEVEIIGDLGEALATLVEACPFAKEFVGHSTLREIILAELTQYVADEGFPLKPQRVLADLRQALSDEDLLICDVGANKIWAARMYQAHSPNTVIISNGLAAMGIAVPGALVAKLAYPQQKVVALTGDGGFMMNSQELETAKRLGTPFVTMIWVDSGYGMIEWEQVARYGQPYGVHFTNPDFVAYARSFGLAGFRIDHPNQLLPTLRQALDLNEPSVIEVPIDYRENLKLTERLGKLTCPF
ncbi:MAG: acetolactate synthase large subunit [Chloroflexi bacterium]|nr:acetolactate synthase large subunit [Chloroflexota bacterium]